jgi:predicted Zn-dependent protease
VVEAITIYNSFSSTTVEMSMKRTARFLIGSCFALLVAGSAVVVQAQSYYEIEGVVDGPDAKPLNGIAVYLEDQTRSRLAQAITAGDGRFQFSRVTSGVYYIVVRPNNTEFRPTERRVELLETARFGSNTATERVDIALEPIARRGDFPATVVFAQEVPPPAKAKFDHALDQIGKKKTDMALKDLTDALEIFPDYFMAAQQLGLLYVEIERYQQAIPPLVKAIEVNPKAGSAYVALGIASLKLGRADLALDALQRAQPLEDKSFRLHFYLGLTFLQLERLDEAEKALRESYRLGGPSKAASAHLYLASIQSKRGNKSEAIVELETYLRENPKAANVSTIKEAIAHLKNQP